MLIVDLGFLLFSCCHFYKPVMSATGDVHTFQEEKGFRKVSTAVSFQNTVIDQAFLKMEDMGGWKKVYQKDSGNGVSSDYNESWFWPFLQVFRAGSAFAEVPKLVQVLGAKYPCCRSANTDLQFVHKLVRTGSGVPARHCTVVCMN